MMGYLEDNIETALITKTTGGIIVLPDDNVVVKCNRQNWDTVPASAVRPATNAVSAASFARGGCWAIRWNRIVPCAAWASISAASPT